MNEQQTKRPAADDRCKSCGSDSLWSGYFDKDDFGDPYGLPTSRWTTFCNDCGTEWSPATKRRKK